jgi:high-affinity iron transporter
VASIIITVMGRTDLFRVCRGNDANTDIGAALLRISKLQDKWRMKLALALESRDKSETMIKTKFIRRRLIQGSIKHWCEKYAMFLLPFITVLREGLEAVVFIGGVSLSIPATAFPLAVISGLGCGILIGYLIYRLVLSCHSQHHRLPIANTLW